MSDELGDPSVMKDFVEDCHTRGEISTRMKNVLSYVIRRHDIGNIKKLKGVTDLTLLSTNACGKRTLLAIRVWMKSIDEKTPLNDQGKNATIQKIKEHIVSAAIELVNADEHSAWTTKNSDEYYDVAGRLHQQIGKIRGLTGLLSEMKK